MNTTELSHAIHMVGIELRTSNREAMDTIPPHWQRFAQEAVLERIPHKLDGDVLAVYTHFEDAGSSNTGLYSLILGAAVAPDVPVPAGMVRAVVPASVRAEFAVEPARIDQVGPQWAAIWARTELPKTFIAEFERYHAGGAITISIGLR